MYLRRWPGRTRLGAWAERVDDRLHEDLELFREGRILEGRLPRGVLAEQPAFALVERAFGAPRSTAAHVRSAVSSTSATSCGRHSRAVAL
jgi:hypothetical protein